jgi:hypothetical protein
VPSDLDRTVQSGGGGSDGPIWVVKRTVRSEQQWIGRSDLSGESDPLDLDLRARV